MNKLDFVRFVENVRTSVVKHSPEILTGIGIAGMITTTVLAVRSTPKALQLIEKKKREDRKDKLTPVETIKAAWKCYIPAAITGVASTACIIGASTVSLQRNAALAAAYKLSETALTEYKDKVVEVVGEKKEKTIREAVYQDKIDKHPVEEEEIANTGKGTTLCMDPLSARYFYSSIEHIRRAENSVNKQLIHDICGTATLNDFYDELEIEHTDVGEHIGWSTDRLIDLDIYPGMHNGKPCLVIGHHNFPTWSD